MVRCDSMIRTPKKIKVGSLVLMRDAKFQVVSQLGIVIRKVADESWDVYWFESKEIFWDNEMWLEVVV